MSFSGFNISGKHQYIIMNSFSRNPPKKLTMKMKNLKHKQQQARKMLFEQAKENRMGNEFHTVDFAALTTLLLVSA